MCYKSVKNQSLLTLLKFIYLYMHFALIATSIYNILVRFSALFRWAELIFRLHVQMKFVNVKYLKVQLQKMKYWTLKVGNYRYPTNGLQKLNLAH